MSTIEDGGPAFPVPYSNEADGPTVMPSPGMTLRDYLAAHASEEDVAAAEADLGRATTDQTPLKKPFSVCRTYTERRAIARLYFADAMLKARATGAGHE